MRQINGQLVTQSERLVSRLLAAGCIFLSVSLSACANENGETPKHNAAEPNTPALTIEEQMAYARIDLISQLSIDSIEPNAINAKPITWRSGALGCPKPGQVYTQALVKGVLILIRHDGSVYAYHAKVAGVPFYCPTSRAFDDSEVSPDV